MVYRFTASEHRSAARNGRFVPRQTLKRLVEIKEKSAMPDVLSRHFRDAPGAGLRRIFSGLNQIENKFSFTVSKSPFWLNGRRDLS